LFFDANYAVIDSHLEPVVTIITVTIVLLILAIYDFIDAHIVVIFNVTLIADLHTIIIAVISLYFAVFDFRAAQVFNDFNEFCLAIQTSAIALLVNTVLDRRDTHVFILSEMVAVVTVETLSVTVVLVAVGNFRYTGAIAGQREAFFAGGAFAKVALTALVGGRRHARQ